MDFVRYRMGRLRSPKRLMIGVVRRLVGYPAIRSIGEKVLKHFPFLRNRLKRVVKDHMMAWEPVSNGKIRSTGTNTKVALEELALTPAARAVLSEWRKAMQQGD
jgi:hypothetical protein